MKSDANRPVPIRSRVIERPTSTVSAKQKKNDMKVTRKETGDGQGRGA